MGDIADAIVAGEICERCQREIVPPAGQATVCRQCKGEWGLTAERSIADRCEDIYRQGRATKEPARMTSTKVTLVRMGCHVEKGPDAISYRVIFPSGRRFHFWPYSGWFAGPTQGRGFSKLLKAGGMELADPDTKVSYEIAKPNGTADPRGDGA